MKQGKNAGAAGFSEKKGRGKRTRSWKSKDVSDLKKGVMRRAEIELKCRIEKQVKKELSFKETENYY